MLEKITALLHLSFKYDFGDIRKDILEQLSRLYPTHLDQFDDVEDESFTMFDGERWMCHVPLLKAAVKAGIDNHFPSLYYACSEFEISEILNFFSDSPTTCPTLHRLLEGREKLGRAIQGLMTTFIEETERCVFQLKSEGHGVSLDGDSLADIFDTYHLKGLSAEVLWTQFPDRACVDCKSAIGTRFEGKRREIWDMIPKYFGFHKSWDEIRTELRSQ